MATLDLRDFWSSFVKTYTSRLLSPSVLMQAGEANSYLTQFNLFEIEDRRLTPVVRDLVNTRGRIIFFAGLPLMPHDAGYQIGSIEISPDEIVCCVTLNDKQRSKKRSLRKKTTRFEEIAKKSPVFSGLRAFGLPIKVRFNYGHPDD